MTAAATKPVLTGGCQCGAIRFALSAAPTRVSKPTGVARTKLTRRIGASGNGEFVELAFALFEQRDHRALDDGFEMRRLAVRGERCLVRIILIEEGR